MDEDENGGDVLREKLLNAVQGVFVGHTSDEIAIAVFGLLIAVVRTGYKYNEKQAAKFVFDLARNWKNAAR